MRYYETIMLKQYTRAIKFHPFGHSFRGLRLNDENLYPWKF